MSPNHLPSSAAAPRPVPRSMKLSGDSTCPVGIRKIPPTAVRKFNPCGDILASALPSNESYTENFPPMSMSPKWEWPFDVSGAAEIPNAVSVRMRCASGTVSRFWEAKGPLVVIAVNAEGGEIPYSRLERGYSCLDPNCASVPEIGMKGDLL